jgi:hypothetical protein
VESPLIISYTPAKNIVVVSLIYIGVIANMPVIRPQTLNDVFLEAANQARQKVPELSHNQQVCHCRFFSSCVVLLFPSNFSNHCVYGVIITG